MKGDLPCGMSTWMAAHAHRKSVFMVRMEDVPRRIGQSTLEVGSIAGSDR